MFKKKGNKVLCCYTAIKYISGAVQGFILTTSTWHLIIYIRVFNFFNFIFIFRHLYLNWNLAELGHFLPILANWLHQNTHNWLIRWFIDLQMIQMWPLGWAIQCLGVLGGKLGKKYGSSSQNWLQKLIFGQNFSFSPH